MLSQMRIQENKNIHKTKTYKSGKWKNKIMNKRLMKKNKSHIMKIIEWKNKILIRMKIIQAKTFNKHRKNPLPIKC